jgi:hypothetical protein
MPKFLARSCDRPAAMAWLSARYSWTGFAGLDFNDASLAGRVALISRLEGKCRSMRAAGLAGAWHYDLPLHTELKRILDAERAALAAVATESLPTPSDRQSLRVAA